MIKDIRLPELSESTHSADVVKVLVQVGDTIQVDQPLLELETEKAVFEMPSTEAGTVVEVLAQKGQELQVGQVVARVETSGAATETAASPAAKAPVAPPPLQKSAPPIPPPAPEPARPQRGTPPSPVPSATPAVHPDGGAPRPSAPAAPGVRRLARELGVDITRVEGTGPRGRISADDVKIYAKLVMGGQPGAPGTAPVKALPDFARFGPVRREPMSKVRRITAEGMAHAWATVPTVTQYDKADITDLDAFRAKHAKKVEAAGGKLTMTSILAKVTAGALKAFPQFNASVDQELGEIVYKDFVHIGIAVDTDRGLLVPVVRDADKKNINVLCVEIAALAEKARAKRIAPEDMEGGSFTISNLGGIGGVGFSPIVYWPQVAILGVSRSEMLPVWRVDRFVPRLFLPLSLSYDHRVIDGADGARFLRWICEAMEDPMLLALEG